MGKSAVKLSKNLWQKSKADPLLCAADIPADTYSIRLAPVYSANPQLLRGGSAALVATGDEICNAFIIVHGLFLFFAACAWGIARGIKRPIYLH